MSRTLVGNVETIDLAIVSPLKRIHTGSEVQMSLENINELHAEWWPSPMVQQCWQSDTTTPYIEPTTTSYVLNGIWRRRVHQDSEGSTVRVYRENGGTQSAGIKVELASDAATYNATLVVPASASAAWASLDPGIDSTQTRDTLRMWTKETVAGAALKVHATTIEPTPLSSIPAGVSAKGAVPFDTAEIGADKPLSTWQRKIGFDNLQVIRKTRLGDIVGWSEDWDVQRTQEAYQETSSTFQLVAEFNIHPPIGCDTIEWSCTGFYEGSSGSVKVVVAEGSENEDSQTQAFTTKASSPYTANIHDCTDLTCVPNAPQTFKVYLKGDGTTRAVLMGLCAWYGDVT